MSYYVDRSFVTPNLTRFLEVVKKHGLSIVAVLTHRHDGTNQTQVVPITDDFQIRNVSDSTVFSQGNLTFGVFVSTEHRPRMWKELHSMYSLPIVDPEHRPAFMIASNGAMHIQCPRLIEAWKRIVP